MTTTREALSDVIADLESRGLLTGEDAARLRRAVVWRITTREAFSYLGGLIVSLGLIFTLSALADDLTTQTVTGGLAILGVACAAGAWTLRRRDAALIRVANLLAVVATGALAAALGLALHLAGLDGRWATVVASALSLATGLALASPTRFAGTLITIIAPQPLLAAGIDLLGLSEYVAPLLYIASGAMLIWLGTRSVGFALGARLAGAISATGANFVLTVVHDNIAADGLALVGVLVLFVAGLRQRMLEAVVVAGVGTVVQVGVASNSLFPSSGLAQGIAVTTCGVAVVIGSLAIFRRDRSAV